MSNADEAAAINVARQHHRRPSSSSGTRLTRFPLSASIGVSGRQTTRESPEQLLHRADQAMYRAKGAGPGRFSYDGLAHASATPDD